MHMSHMFMTSQDYTPVPAWQQAEFIPCGNVRCHIYFLRGSKRRMLAVLLHYSGPLLEPFSHGKGL